MRVRLAYRGALLTLTLSLLSCGGDDGGTGVDAYLPTLPATGGAATVLVRQITEATAAQDLIDGEARGGLIGDYVMKNDKISVVVQRPNRSISPVPFGGNIIDADLVRPPSDAFADPDDDAADGVGNDQFGEMSPIYLVGRTFAVDSAEIVRDGSKGGAAVLRFRGHTAVNDYINLRGLNFDPPNDFDPNNDDTMAVAITYILAPGSNAVEVHWSMYNPGPYVIRGPLGVLSDSGGNTSLFGDGKGFARAGLDNLSSLEGSVRYPVYQAPGIAYGILPRDLPANRNQVGSVLIQGVGVTLFGITSLLDILDETKGEFLHLEPKTGARYTMDFVVAKDGNEVEKFRVARDKLAAGKLSGTVTIGGAAPSAATELGKLRPRVGFFTDSDTMPGFTADDRIESYADIGDDGKYSVELTPGTYFVVADLEQLSRSQAMMVTVAAGAEAMANVDLPKPGVFDFEILDDATSMTIPGRVMAVGKRPFKFDTRFGEDYDSRNGIINLVHARNGDTSGQGGDRRLIVPSGGSYRVFVTRGNEWSFATADLPAVAGGLSATKLTFRLKRALDTVGYAACDFHQHANRSPDSTVPLMERVRSYLSEGLEYFAGTEHDFIVDYEPLIAKLSAQSLIDSSVGIEATPFDWGHFNIWPLTVDAADPAGGAVDWGNGEERGLVPADMFTAYRQARGAKVVQINHARSGGGLDFQAFFDRAALKFDFTAKTFGGVVAAQPLPNTLLRLPEEKMLFTDQFDAIEVWNGFAELDDDMDGVREFRRTDLLLRDLMSFYTFGKIFTPTGNSDSHTSVKDPAAMPRTYVGVPSDDAGAIQAGLADDVEAALLGKQGAFRDTVVTNGPFLRVTDAAAAPLIGRTIKPTAGAVTLNIKASAPAWMGFDTIEVIGGDPPGPFMRSQSAIVPISCFTARTGRLTNDVCDRARVGGAQTLTVAPGTGTGGAERVEASVTVTLQVTDVNAAASRRGTPGSPDFILFVRVYGMKGTTFPVLNEGIFSKTDDTLLTAVSTGPVNDLPTVLAGKGPFPMAFTAPILVDADGDGVWKGAYQP